MSSHFLLSTLKNTFPYTHEIIYSSNYSAIRFSNTCLLSVICILIEKSKIKSHLILSSFVSDSVLRVYSRYNLSDILNPSSKELGFMKDRISRKNIQRNLICDGSHDFLSQR